ncbi:hypothetical protein [Streptomyces sp. NPDC058718]|uniref:hypothetical protein n=1 Tax=Streptomyces sp. NPDC058718 TaxID=3346610 RepID=UPI0036BFDF94
MREPVLALPQRAAIERMARREAAAQLLPSPDSTVVTVDVRECPTCGGGEEVVRTSPLAVQPGLAVFGDVPDPAAEAGPVVTVLGCEILTPRSLLPAIVLRHHDGSPAVWRTRAVAWAQSANPGVDRHSDVEQLIVELAEEEAESDASLVPGGGHRLPPRTSPRALVLPASTRLNPAAVGLRESVPPAARFLSPHLDGPQAQLYEKAYRVSLLRTVAAHL